MRNNTGKHPKICNFKQQSKRREYNAFSKTYFFLTLKSQDQSNYWI